MSQSQEVRRCGICNKPLSQYNKDDICMSHQAMDVAEYRERQKQQGKESRAILAFVTEFHGAGAAEDIMAKAKKGKQTSTLRRAVTELERYPEALGLLKIASMVFRLSMPSILRKNKDPTKGLKAKIARDVLIYVMHKDLGLPPEDIGIFVGYSAYRVLEGRRRIEAAMLVQHLDEDLICAVDIIRRERDWRLAEEE